MTSKRKSKSSTENKKFGHNNFATGEQRWSTTPHIFGQDNSETIAGQPQPTNSFTNQTSLTPIKCNASPATTSHSSSALQSKNTQTSRKQMPTTSTNDNASTSRAPRLASNSRRQKSTPAFTPPLQDSGSAPTSAYKDLGDCQCVCQYCSAIFWPDERSKQYFKDGRVHYNKCCNIGKVRLPMAPDPPDYIKELFLNRHFMDNIRAYNSMFSMTSFGASVDETINNGSGPYVFKVSGQIYHWMGTLCPSQGSAPKFLQLYICDTKNEARNRIMHFGGEDSTPLKQDTVEGLIKILDQNNHLVKLFRTARDKCADHDIPEFKIRLFNKPTHSQYELPTTDSLGAIVFEADPATLNEFDVIIHSKDGLPQRINKLHPAYMSMQFPLFFIYGESGYQQDMKLTDPLGGILPKTRRLTIKMFYSFQLHDRVNMHSLILRGGRLFQQYIVNAWLAIEQCRLDYIQQKQSDIRGEYLQGIHDAILRGDHDGSDVGSRTILPSSFVGGPRYMYKHYQDALAICRVHGNPQFFVTFTCNTKWPEINRYVQKFQLIKAQNKPEIVDRVFEMKVKKFVKFLKAYKILGDIVADLYTIEFQKRGLPHCHLLLWLTPETRIRSPEEVDKYISAEIPDADSDPDSYRVVSEFMMHGPCGSAQPDAVCMKNKACSKSFPKEYVQNTYFDDNGYVHYRRRDTGSYVKKYDQELDNSYVVPYNRLLSLTFFAHINVEYCGWTMLIKYLFKYISKGSDKTRAHITRSIGEAAPSSSNSRPPINEIHNYVKARYICPHEAAWRIIGFEIHERSPPIQMLAIHLRNMQYISLRARDQLTAVAGISSIKRTTLTGWFEYNSNYTQGRHLTYIQFPTEFAWYANGTYWSERANKKKYSIGRLSNVPPTDGELFYLRMLLSHQKGCTCYEDVRTVNNILYPTFRSACQALGLLGDDTEWTVAFNEAAAWATASELRTLFAHMLIYCEIVDPVRLWNAHWKQMVDDIPMRISASLQMSNFQLNDDAEGYLLYEMEIILNACSRSLETYGLPTPPSHLLHDINNRLHMEERNYNRDSLSIENHVLVNKLNSKQRRIYDTIVTGAANNHQELIFVYGHGGTGKTFLWKAIITALRAQGKIVLAVASSGITSLLLPSGRTAYSRFKLPLDITDESVCNIKKGTQLANLLGQTDLVLWDEAPMNNRRCFEALDRSLRDILDNPNKLFGGKSVILGGDFRQTLPVQRGGSKADIISSSLPESYLWSQFTICTLSENMRLLHPNLTEQEKIQIQMFSKWLLDIGDGILGTRDEADPENSSWVKIPEKYLIQDHNNNGISELIKFIYDEDTLKNPTAESLQDKAIVCPKNETADTINTQVLSSLPGNPIVYNSFDMVSAVSGDGGESDILYPSEYLNTLNFKSLPQHQLILKVGAPVMLIRNMNLLSGLCNGTRMIITQCLSKVIEAKVITGTKIGHKVFLPRIQLIHKDPTLPFIFKRKQFPIKVCYAMTINKSQGQSLNKIGVYLPDPIFGHGQLYVAMSRATSPDGLKLLIRQQEDQPEGCTKNMVYTDFLENIAHMQANVEQMQE